MLLLQAFTSQMSTQIGEERTLDLIAVIIHEGEPTGGHYVCRAVRRNRLVQLDDDKVTSVTSLQHRGAYVLVYWEADSEVYPYGIPQLGNSCYLAAVLQALASSKESSSVCADVERIVDAEMDTGN